MKMKNKINNADSTLIKDVLQILQTARERTYAHINKEMVQT